LNQRTPSRSCTSCKPMRQTLEIPDRILCRVEVHAQHLRRRPRSAAIELVVRPRHFQLKRPTERVEQNYLRPRGDDQLCGVRQTFGQNRENRPAV
jgi:hypothetical protein